jgi:hypothetical protein
MPHALDGFLCSKLFVWFEVNWLHGLDQATTNLLHKKIRREDGATCYDIAQHPIRHLGILLSVAGAEQHAAALFTQRLQTITWRVRQWAR